MHFFCMSHVHAFPMHTYFLFNTFDIIDVAWDFSDCSSLFLHLFLFTLVVPMAPKRKSTLARNPLRSGASSSSDPSPSNVRFCDDDAFKAFSENFSRQGIHSKRQVVLSDFADTNLLSIIQSRDGSHCVMSRSLVLSYLSRSSTPTCTGLIVQYLSSSFTFGVRVFLSHRNWLRICFGSLG